MTALVTIVVLPAQCQITGWHIVMLATLMQVRGVYTIGQPRVGDYEFAQELVKRFGGTAQNPSYIRIVNSVDIVPAMPPPGELPWTRRLSCFSQSVSRVLPSLQAHKTRLRPPTSTQAIFCTSAPWAACSLSWNSPASQLAGCF